MFRPAILLLILLSVGLSSASQLLLKVGMSSASVQQAMSEGPPLRAIGIALLTPLVFLGLACFSLSAVFWLFVLSKIDVSYAYPCVALGIVFTVAGAHFALGEPVSMLRIAGLGVIALGVSLVAASG